MDICKAPTLWLKARGFVYLINRRCTSGGDYVPYIYTHAR